LSSRSRRKHAIFKGRSGLNCDKLGHSLPHTCMSSYWLRARPVARLNNSFFSDCVWSVLYSIDKRASRTKYFKVVLYVIRICMPNAYCVETTRCFCIASYLMGENFVARAFTKLSVCLSVSSSSVRMGKKGKQICKTAC
jgi:hypothetical protein